MKIIGCDFHPSWQQVAVFDAETGEVTERKLVNGDGAGLTGGVCARSFSGFFTAAVRCADRPWFRMTACGRMGRSAKGRGPSAGSPRRPGMTGLFQGDKVYSVPPFA